MLQLVGAKPIVGIALGSALLAGGLLANRPLLAIAGGVVGLISALRLLLGQHRLVLPSSWFRSRPTRPAQRQAK